MKNPKTIITLAFAFLLLSTDYCFARAGGGGSGGGGGGGGIVGLILLPFVLIYSAIVTAKLRKKMAHVQELTTKLEKTDHIWNYRTMKARVEEVFFKVQHAWMERDQDIAKDCMSDRIYMKHKEQTDEMIRNGTKNMLANMNIEDIMIYSISDYKDDSMDTFSAYIKGSMIDYTINTRTGSLASGKEEDRTTSNGFKEIWVFLRKGNTWVLDEIDESVTIGEVNQGVAFTESNV